MTRTIFYIILILFTLSGCDSNTPEVTTKAENKEPVKTLPVSEVTTLLEDPSEAIVLETSAEAIPTWFRYSKSKPVLLLLSKNPLLQIIPEEVREQVQELTLTGSVEDFRQKALATTVAPVMLPTMALSAALDADFFSRVVWVLPVAPGESITLEDFLQKLLNLNDISQTDAETFQGGENGFSGTIRGIPFTVVLKSDLPAFSESAIVHFDLGFLGGDYQNEIRTPLYKHTSDLLNQLKEARINVHAVTISASNLTKEVSLRTRFLGDRIRDIIKDPTLLEKEISGNDALRNEVLYLGNFFKKEEILGLCRKMVENNPQDAAAHYDLYQILRQFRQVDEALAHLEQAVEIDYVYAQEYLELADVALERNRPEGALKVLKKAATVFTENPFIIIQQADIMMRMGQWEQPEKSLIGLKDLPWSTVYHGNIPRYLDEMLMVAQAKKAENETEFAEKDLIHK